MGELVTVLNAAGGAFVAFAAHMLIQSSVLIILLAVLDLVLRRRVKAVVRYWIWLLVLAKLILPPSFSSPTGVAYWVGGALPTLSGPIEPLVDELSTPSLPADGTTVPSEPRGPDSRPSVRYAREEPPVARPDNTPLHVTPHAPLVTWQALVLLGWAVVVIVMAVLLTQRALFIHRLVAQSRAPGPEIVELLRQCARRMGVRAALAVRLSPLSASPSVCGLRRPVVLIPEEMLARLRSNELKSVLLHELAHVKRGDLWLNLVQALLQVVYFYHPLLWAANAWIRRVREQAVDETVLAALGEEAEDYPRALLSVSRAAFGQPTLSLRLLGVVESEKALKDRIRHMVSQPFPKSAKLGFTGLILVFAVGAMLLPMARAKSDASAAGGQASSNEPATLEMLRQLVARNEALLNPIQLDYTVQFDRPDEPQSPAPSKRQGRPYSRINLSWAQRGSKQYLKEEAFFGPNEPGRNTVTVLDESSLTEIHLPDRKTMTIQSRDSTDCALTLPGMLEMHPSQGQHALTDLLVPGCATLHTDMETIKGRPAYVIDVSRPLISSGSMRIWLDREAGVPIRVRHFDGHPTVPPAHVWQEVNDVNLHRLENGGWIPISGVRTSNPPFPRVRRHIRVDVNSIRLQEQVPASLFEIDPPPGAAVNDVRSGLTSIVGQPAQTYGQVTEDGSRFIAGTVAEESGAAVGGVVVTAVAIVIPQEDGRTMGRILRPAPCATTDARGRFALALPEEGTYDLLFRHPDFAYAALDRVPPGERNLRVTLDTGGVLTGRVVRMAHGRKVPVANVEVQTFAPNTPTLKSGQLCAVTDAEGRFEFRGLDMNRRRPRFGSEKEVPHSPISWRVFCGRAVATATFEQGQPIQPVELVLRPDPASAPSLMGKALPGLEALGVKLRAEDVEDKMLLVCFFDLNQRPARHCVEQLMRKAQELRDKGITIIAIQAVEAEPDALAAWRRETRVPFLVGAIPEDTPEHQYTWSVRSLPWLILTDKDHVVRAEGFGLEELAGKLRAVERE